MNESFATPPGRLVLSSLSLSLSLSEKLMLACTKSPSTYADNDFAPNKGKQWRATEQQSGFYFLAFSINFLTISFVVKFLKLFCKLASRVSQTQVQ